MKKIIISLIYFNLLITLHAQKGRIEGVIKDLKNNIPIPFATIIITGTNIGTTSDPDGKYIITNLEPGFYKLQISSIGYKTIITEDIQVVSNKTTYIDFSLEEQEYAIDAVVVKTEKFIRRPESPVSFRSISISEIENAAGANRDIARIIQNYPGVAAFPGANRNDIIVRGGASNESRFYVDDIEIPYINHFATQGASGGTNGILNADLIRSAEFLAGAFPAKRYNALSAFFDFKLMDGNNEKGRYRGSVGASEISFTTDGPINDNSTYILSLRRSYLQFLFKALKLPFLPTFNDYQFKVRYKINNQNEITLLSIGALDVMRLDTKIKNPTEEQRYILEYLPVYQQWSYATGIVFKHFDEIGSWTFVLSRNMLNNSQYKYKDNIEINENKILDYDSDEQENKIRIERNSRYNNIKLNFGINLEYVKYTNMTFQKLFLNEQINTLNFNSNLEYFKYGLFLQGSNSFLNDKLTLSLGLRSDATTYNNETSNLINQISPRISISYRINEKWNINTSTGKYYQLPPNTILGYRDNQGDLINKEKGIKFINATHYITGLAYQPSSFTRFSMEVFLKNYNNYPFALNDSISFAFKPIDYGFIGNEPAISSSEGRAYGMEFLLQSSPSNETNIIISYTYSISEFKDKNGSYKPTSWDNRHVLNISANKKFKNNWRGAVKWRYAGGLPYTPYDLSKSSLISAWDVQKRPYFDYDNLNSKRFKSFHQLDLKIEKWFVMKTVTLRTYIDIQNLYNFKAESLPRITNLDTKGNIMYNPDDPNRYLLREIPSSGQGTVLPTIGLVIDF